MGYRTKSSKLFNYTAFFPSMRVIVLFFSVYEAFSEGQRRGRDKGKGEQLRRTHTFTCINKQGARTS